MLALIIANGRKVPHVGIWNLRSHLKGSPEVFIVCSEVFIFPLEVFIVCSEVFIRVRFWGGFKSGPRRFMKLLIRRNWPPRLVRIEKLL
jgi:hypothetical protein